MHLDRTEASKTSPFLPVAGVIAVALFAASAGAEPGEDARGGRRGPPPVAIDACSGIAENEACSFEGRRGDTLSGTCALIEETLACVPEGHGRRGNRQHGKPCDGDHAGEREGDDAI